MFNKVIQVNNKLIGEGQPTYIVAEISANHNNSLDSALELVFRAHDAGADAVKLQSYDADSLTLNSLKKDFLIDKNSPWADHKNLHNLFNVAAMPWEWHEPLFAYANSIGIEIFSSPFCINGFNLLESLDVSLYKIASPEVYHHELIKCCMATRKPLIVSLGVADQSDIYSLIDTAVELDFQDLVLMKCTASYPAHHDKLNLKTIELLKSQFGCIVGFSDHTLGIEAAPIAVATGASIIEKHICLTGDNGPDSFFSTNYVDFKEMVSKIRDAEVMLGSKDLEIPIEVRSDMRGRRSLYFSKSLIKGDVITNESIAVVRPSFGMNPKFKDQVIGKTIERDVEIGDRVTESVISNFKYQVSIIGLGRIVLGDGHDINTNRITTHLDYIIENPRLNLLCGIDVDNKRCALLKDKLNCDVFFNINDAKDVVVKSDVFILADLPSTRLENIRWICLNTEVKKILIEKPVSENIYDSKKIVDLCEKYNIECVVNYQRRTSKFYKYLKSILSNQNPLEFYCLYSGTFNNIGTHFLDLFCYITGCTERLTKVYACNDFVEYNFNQNKISLVNITTSEFYQLNIFGDDISVYIDLITGFVEIKYVKIGKNTSFMLDENTYFKSVGNSLVNWLDGNPPDFTNLSSALCYME